MKNLLHLIFHDHRWFIGSVIALILFGLFWWYIFDEPSFIYKINGFIDATKAICANLIAIALVLAVIATLLGWRPFGKKGGGH